MITFTQLMQAHGPMARAAAFFTGALVNFDQKQIEIGIANLHDAAEFLGYELKKKK